MRAERGGAGQPSCGRWYGQEAVGSLACSADRALQAGQPLASCRASRAAARCQRRSERRIRRSGPSSVSVVSVRPSVRSAWPRVSRSAAAPTPASSSSGLRAAARPAAMPRSATPRIRSRPCAESASRARSASDCATRARRRAASSSRRELTSTTGRDPWPARSRSHRTGAAWRSLGHGSPAQRWPRCRTQPGP